MLSVPTACPEQSTRTTADVRRRRTTDLGLPEVLEPAGVSLLLRGLTTNYSAYPYTSRNSSFTFSLPSPPHCSDRCTIVHRASGILFSMSGRQGRSRGRKAGRAAVPVELNVRALLHLRPSPPAFCTIGSCTAELSTLTKPTRDTGIQCSTSTPLRLRWLSLGYASDAPSSSRRGKKPRQAFTILTSSCDLCTSAGPEAMVALLRASWVWRFPSRRLLMRCSKVTAALSRGKAFW